MKMMENSIPLLKMKRVQAIILATFIGWMNMSQKYVEFILILNMNKDNIITALIGWMNMSRNNVELHFVKYVDHFKTKKRICENQIYIGLCNERKYKILKKHKLVSISI
jgi:hypothetical protein